ncbi:MAG: heparinase II/III family protein [Alphaproteobacteria bacterium]|nr:heparinase II/III family protein [Alphaproteobacteria bacterium]
MSFNMPFQLPFLRRPVDIISHLKNKAGEMTYGSFLYDWSLTETPPERLSTKPADPWKGDSQKGQELLDAADVGSEDERTGPQWFSPWWSPDDTDEIWMTHMHSFLWLRDLRALGGPVAREQGRVMIENWIETYKNWNAATWRSDLTGERISMWIAHYDYFIAGNDDAFIENFMTSINKQAKHLHNTLGDPRDPGYFSAIKGLLYAGLALEHETWTRQALCSLENTVEKQILADGGHVSRSPAILLGILETLVEINSALSAGGLDIPEFLEDSIQNASAVIRFFRHGDRRFALFHSTQEGNSTQMDAILSQAGLRGKARYSLPYSGFERASLGRSLLIMDIGRSPEHGLDTKTHASPLAFEFSYGKNRIFTSCGTHPSNKNWQEALRFTNGHNTACLDHRNACELKADGHFGRKVTEFSLKREETKEAILLKANHNGYMPLNGIIHERSIYMGDEGHDLRGEDNFTSEITLVHPIEGALRFHLHPSVKVSLINDDQEALLRIPDGSGWRFSFSAGMLELEDSLYMGQGVTPRKTKQLVIRGTMQNAQSSIKWALKREG